MSTAQGHDSPDSGNDTPPSTEHTQAGTATRDTGRQAGDSGTTAAEGPGFCDRHGGADPAVYQKIYPVDSGANYAFGGYTVAGRDERPITVRTHGASGYRQGCRCGVCGDGERARQRGEAPPVVGAVPARAAAGEILKQTRKLIRSLDLPDTPEVALLKAQAVTGARALDAALAHGRPLSASNRMHAAAVKALKAAVVPPPPPPSPPVTDDARGDWDVWVEAIHRPTIVCQPDYPQAVPGVCAACDAAVLARQVYGRRHPEEAGHEYGMGRRECGCAACAGA